jgi:hypothetical protein
MATYKPWFPQNVETGPLDPSSEEYACVTCFENHVVLPLVPDHYMALWSMKIEDF